MTKKEFIDAHKYDIIRACRHSGLFPSVKMAQAALETGWGKHTVGSANNLFGIKASGKHTPYWKGAFEEALTKEWDGSKYVSVKSKFRKYASFEDSVRDHSFFLSEYDRYDPVFAAKTPEEQARALQDAKYATAPNYAKKLVLIINSNNLKELDEAMLKM